MELTALVNDFAAIKRTLDTENAVYSLGRQFEVDEASPYKATVLDAASKLAAHETAGAQTAVSQACSVSTPPIMSRDSLIALTASNYTGSGDRAQLRRVNAYCTTQDTASTCSGIRDVNGSGGMSSSSSLPPYTPSTLPDQPTSGAPGSLGVILGNASPVNPEPYMGAHPNVYFVSPSGNIGCYIFVEYGNRAECTISRYNFSEPGYDCPNGAFVSISAGESPSDVQCASSAVSPGSGGVLPYGRSVTNDRVACVSNFSGVSCLDIVTGAGFTLSRTAWTPVY